MKIQTYRRIAGLLQAIENCDKSGNSEWYQNHKDSLRSIIVNHLPSGSGIDAGTDLDMELSRPNRIVFTFGFHFLDENGMYDGWEDYTLTIKPDLMNGFDMKIQGPNRDGIKDHLYEVFDFALREDIEW